MNMHKDCSQGTDMLVNHCFVHVNTLFLEKLVIVDIHINIHVQAYVNNIPTYQ